MTGNNAGEKYRLLSRYARDIILIARLQDGRIIEANRAAEEAYRYTRDQMLSLTISDLRADKDAAAVARRMAQATREGILFESVHARADGSVFPVEVSAAIANLGDTPVILSIIRDITERKHAEQALRENAERIRLIISTIKDYAIFSIDLSGTVITWNEGAERVTGYKSEEIIGRNDSILYALEDVTAGRPEQILAAAIEQGYYEETGWRVRKNGTRFWADATTTVLLDEKGKPKGFSKIIRDITERKQAEEELKKYQQFLQLSQEAGKIGSFEWDIVADKVIYSPEFAALYGLPPGAVTGGYSEWRKFTYPEDRARVDEEVSKQLKSQDFSVEYRIVWPDGSVHWLLSRSKITLDKQGRPIRAIGVIADVTDRKQAEDNERKLEAGKLEFYRRLIFAATEGKLVITDKSSILGMPGLLIHKWPLTSASDLAPVRHSIADVAELEGMEKTRISKFVIASGEAATNALKHAGKGTASLHKLPDALFFVVSDNGPGIEEISLPDVALTRGYSTAGTLGMGYKIMISYTDKVLLASGPGGTTVGLEMKFEHLNHPEVPGFGGVTASP